MKRFTTALPVLVGAALALAWACDGGGPAAPLDEPVIEDISEAEILASHALEGLTEEQRAAVGRILREARARLQRVREAVRSGELTLEEARALARRIHEETIQRLSEILTEEQLQALLDHRSGDRGGIDPPLTDEQKARIQELRSAFHAFVREQRAAVQAGELTAEEARANVLRAARRLRAAVCDVLTPEQREDVRHCSVPSPTGG